ncbi:LacI family DNA-binding transcriptional regulator [Microlunatus flavus]|uniref:LacI family transcriptional regulator n=1 Tax=Microlunatus flavus TaxID=1036181 RepID=A0A1H9AFY8_9ACTN|nr:LacI family DNA-binding transcriptional regulator [Microlunatus flavus]SEP74858.1 LacI family transcriptional regulator [Microlunatus flavus]
MTAGADAPDGRRRTRGSGASTVQDVAAEAGVSPMTVSRVLSGAQHVRPELRERVEAAVLHLGYHRDENARSLRRRRSGLIGVTITNIANPYYAGLQRGIEEVAARHERRILVGNSNEDPVRERQLVGDFVGRRVEGLVVVPSGQGPATHLQPKALGGVPLVLASRAVEGVDADTVLIDDVRGAYEAATLLLREGHTRIAFLGNRVSVFTGQRRFAGFRQAHEEAGVPVVGELVRQGQQDVDSAREAMTELLALDDPPTAVFTANNRNTLGAIRAIAVAERDRSGAGGRRQTRVVGFDSFELADLSPVALSLVDHDAEELGRQAAEMLFERLEAAGEDEQQAPRLVELPVRLVEDVARL